VGIEEGLEAVQHGKHAQGQKGQCSCNMKASRRFQRIRGISRRVATPCGECQQISLAAGIHRDEGVQGLEVTVPC
jgi:hypothetical protein